MSELVIALKGYIRDWGEKLFGPSFISRAWVQLTQWRICLGRELLPQDRELVEVLPNYIQRGSTVLDIGANVGLLAGRLQRIVGPSGRVLAFEPIPESFEILQNLWRRYPNIETYNLALSDRDGTAEFLVPKAGFNFPTAAVVSTAEQLPVGDPVGYRQLTLPVRRLDHLASELNLVDVSFVKCDVEGHELPVMRGAQTLLESQLPVISLEILREKWPVGNPLKSAVAQFLASMGYQAYQIKLGTLVGVEEFDPKIENFLFLPSEE